MGLGNFSSNFTGLAVSSFFHQAVLDTTFVGRLRSLSQFRIYLFVPKKKTSKCLRLAKDALVSHFTFGTAPSVKKNKLITSKKSYLAASAGERNIKLVINLTLTKIAYE